MHNYQKNIKSLETPNPHSIKYSQNQKLKSNQVVPKLQPLHSLKTSNQPQMKNKSDMINYTPIKEISAQLNQNQEIKISKMPNKLEIEPANNQKIAKNHSTKQESNQIITQKTFKTTDSDIQILKTIRDEGSKLFDNKRKDHMDALTSLDQMLIILDGYTQGQVELTQLGQTALDFIQLSVKVTNERTLTEISTIFAQVSTESGGYLEVYEKLRNLIVNFKVQLQKNLDEYQQGEDVQIQEYDDRNVHLVEYFNNLKRTEEQLRDHIQAMSLCINQQTAIVDTARGKKVMNLQIHDSAEKMCQDFLAEYEKASQVRKDQIDLIDSVKQQVIEYYANR